MELNNEISINLRQPQEFHLQLYWGGMNETITLSQCALQRGVSYKVGTAEQSLYSEMAEAVVSRICQGHYPIQFEPCWYLRIHFLLLEFVKHIIYIHFPIKIST